MKLCSLIAILLMLTSCIGTGGDQTGDIGVDGEETVGALSIAVTTVGTDHQIHCEDFDGNTVGSSCETGDSDSCTITGLTSEQLSAGLVCVSRGQDWRGAAGYGKPYYVPVLLTPDEIVEVEAGMSEMPIDTETSFGYAAVVYVCGGGLSDCSVETTALQTLIETLGNLPESQSDLSFSLGTVGDALVELFENGDDDTDPVALLYLAMDGNEDLINALLDTPVAAEHFANVVEIFNRILNGNSPFGGPCTDAATCAALFDGTCSPDFSDEADAETTSFNYDDAIYGLTDGGQGGEAAAAEALETILCVSTAEPGEEGCLTLSTIQSHPECVELNPGEDTGDDDLTDTVCRDNIVTSCFGLDNGTCLSSYANQDWAGNNANCGWDDDSSACFVIGGSFDADVCTGGRCGNGTCDDDYGETPASCPEDCPYSVYYDAQGCNDDMSGQNIIEGHTYSYDFLTEFTFDGADCVADYAFSQSVSRESCFSYDAVMTATMSETCCDYFGACGGGDGGDAIYLISLETWSGDLGLGFVYEGAQELMFAMNSGLPIASMSFRYEYGSITNATLSLATGDGGATPINEEPGVSVTNDTDAKVYCGIITAPEAGTNYYAFVSGDYPPALPLKTCLFFNDNCDTPCE